MRNLSLSLVTLCIAGAFATFAPAISHAQSTQSIGANCVAGVHKTPKVQFSTDASKTGKNCTGWAFIAFADGNSFSGNTSAMKVTKLSDGTLEGKETALGYLNDVTPVKFTLSSWQYTNGTAKILVHVYDYYNPSTVYEATGHLAVQSGTFVLTP